MHTHASWRYARRSAAAARLAATNRAERLERIAHALLEPFVLVLPSAVSARPNRGTQARPTASAAIHITAAKGASALDANV